MNSWLLKLELKKDADCGLGRSQTQHTIVRKPPLALVTTILESQTDDISVNLFVDLVNVLFKTRR